VNRSLLIPLSTLWLFFALPVSAVDASKRITQYAHTAWRMQDGFFSGVPQAITQTKDGYIWIGTQNELLRFDGVRLARWTPPTGSQLPPAKIWALLGSRDGSLWIGTNSGLAHWNNQKLVILPDALGTISSIIERSNGEIWFSLVQVFRQTGAVCQVIGDRTKCYGKSEGIPVAGASVLTEDRSGNLWFGDSTTVVRWNGSSFRAFSPSALKGNQSDGVTGIAGDQDGSIWLGFSIRGPGVGLQKVVNDVLKPLITPELDSSTLIVNTLFLDSQNSLWIGTGSQGIYRIHGQSVDHFGRADGLSSDFVAGFYEDRERDLWVATSRGIDCFRDVRVTSFTNREGLPDEVDSVLASRDGTVWAGGPENLSFIRGGKIGSIQSRKGLPGNLVTSLFEDHAGRLWVGLDNSLFIHDKGVFRQITKSNGSSIGFVVGTAEDGKHNVWVETNGPPRSLIRISNFIGQQEFPAPQIPAARKLAVAPDGSVWLGLLSGDLARYKRDKVDIFRFKNSPSPSLESAVNEVVISSDEAVLGATAFGLIAWKDGRQQILTMQNGLPCDVIYSLITDNNGGLWLYTQCGIVEISSTELQKWWKDRNARLQLQTIGAVDGAQPGRVPFQGAAKSPDGRLWFANWTALQVVDPAYGTRNSIAPPVHIENVVAEHKSYDASKDIFLPANTRDLQIDYTALSFVNPQKVNFRYKLEGRDDTWTDVGTRRQAFYTDLRPGTYRFRVIASNNDGLWNTDGATIDFHLDAAWYQTRWFYLSVGIVSLLMVWATYQLRLRQLSRRFSIRLEERVSERTRIARELHDTLLQNLHGVMLEFQAVKNLLYKNPEKAERTLENAIAGTEHAIAESQEAIEDLRSKQAIESDFAELLSALGEELASSPDANQGSPTFRVIVEGERRSLFPVLQDEIYRIAREILRNAFRHASAHKIEAEIRYDADEFRLRVRDDGKGIAQEVLEEGKRAGHWGLPGIQERAQRIAAKIDLWSEAGAGTEVQVSIPGDIAYQKSRKSLRFAILRRERTHERRSKTDQDSNGR
jgi:Signal transduction histidine kinase